jgi:Xaa-Pro aminopeptidase
MSREFLPSLTATGCAARRGRLLDQLSALNVDAAVVSDVRDIYYFIGVLLPSDLPAALLVYEDGRTSLVAPDGCENASVDYHRPYSWNHRGTRHPDILDRMTARLRDALLSRRTTKAALQAQALPHKVAEALNFVTSSTSSSRELDEAISAMQRRKDADEIGVMAASIRANLGAYAAVRATIRPGASELEVLAAGYHGAMTAAGEKVFHDGDYQCGEYNGAARDRRIEAGELYIVDAWTCFRGYWSDMCRTFSVGGPPTDEQRQLFEHIRWVQRETPALLKPGVDGQQVFQALDEMIRQHPRLGAQGLIHHGGHAIGLRSHEMPDINPDRGGKLEPGQVICIEPGGYYPEARFGVRLENMYLITEKGCEDLCPGEVELHECP